MNLEKVVFGFFIVLAATLNFGFFVGDIDRPELHHAAHLFAAIVVNLISTVLKFGDRTQIGAIHLAASLVADLELIFSLSLWERAGVRAL
jgi:putative Ca2+/H+ antiporter (TMEM165/GDT1 family)